MGTGWIIIISVIVWLVIRRIIRKVRFKILIFRITENNAEDLAKNISLKNLQVCLAEIGPRLKTDKKYQKFAECLLDRFSKDFPSIIPFGDPDDFREFRGMVKNYQQGNYERVLRDVFAVKTDFGCQLTKLENSFLTLLNDLAVIKKFELE